MSFNLTVSDCATSFVLYGDESTSRELVSYCLLVVPTGVNTQLQEDILEVFCRYGGTRQSRFHCREIFSKHARDKSKWSHLNEHETWQLANDLASVLKKNWVMCSVGIVHKDTYPQVMPDGKGKQFEIKAETCYAFGFIAAAAGLATENGPGKNARYTLFVDPQSTRFNFFGLKTTRLEELIKSTGLVASKVDFKPLPIDLADLIAYASARALSVHAYRNNQVCDEVFEQASPYVTDYWWGVDQGLRREGKKVFFYPLEQRIL